MALILQKSGLEAALDHFGDQFFDHGGDESARYQPQQGGFQSVLDHFGDHFLTMKVVNLLGVKQFWIFLGIKFLIIKLVNLLGISPNRG